jgi:hypothetical protein
MNKLRKINNWLKNNFLNILVLGLALFCVFNILNKLDDDFTVFTNSLAIFFTIWYFIKFEKNKIDKIIIKPLKESSRDKIKLIIASRVIKPLKQSHSDGIKFIYKKRQDVTSQVITFFKQLYYYVAKFIYKWGHYVISYTFITIKQYSLIAAIFLYKKRWEIISYIFLSFLPLIALGQFFDWSWMKKYQAIIIVLAFMSGGLAMWHNRNKIEKEVKKESDKESEDKKTSKWLYLSILLLILIIGASLRSWNISGLQYGDDEFPSIYTAKNFLENHRMELPSGRLYLRSTPHTVVTAISISIFGFNNFGTRAPSIFFGILTILLTYIITKRIANKRVALFAALLMAVLPWEISWSREARMYSLLQFLYLLIVYLNIKKNELKNNKLILNSLILLVLILTALTHQIGALAFLPIIFISLLGKNKKIIFAGILLFISLNLFKGSLSVWMPEIIKDYGYLLDNEKFFSIYYFKYLINGYTVFFILLIAGMISKIKYLKKDSEGIILIFFYVPLIIISSILSWRQIKYIYFLFPLFIIFSTKYVFYLFAKEKIRILFVSISLLILVPWLNVYAIINNKVVDRKNFDELYGAMSHPDYSVLKNINVSNDDLVLSTNIWGSYHYIGRHDALIRDVKTMAPLASYLYEGKPYDIYTGSLIISSLGELKNIISQYKKVYLIIDHRWSPRVVQPDIYDYINEYFTLRYQSGEIKVLTFGAY